MNPISTLLGRPTRPWEAPRFGQPIVTTANDLRPLGELRGRRWWAHKVGELEERATTLRDDDPALPDSIIVLDTSTGERRWRTFDVRPLGTYERLSNTPARAPKPPRVDGPIDAIAGTLLGGKRSERIVFGATPERSVPNPLLPEVPYAYRPALGPARGAKAIIERLASKGAVLTLAADREHTVLTTPGGRIVAGVVELATVAAPLLVPYLRDGKDASCAVTDHGGKPPVAVTTALALPDSLPWCGTCRP